MVVMSSTVLVVEDEPMVRWMAMDYVQEAGLDALEAPDADQAMTILEANDDIGIVFTDIRMPGSMDGVELARRIKARWPEIYVIVASGHGSSDQALAAGAERFLAKPYPATQLMEVLREFSGPTRH
jgi:two-component system, response regulator PdtaR